MFQKLCFHDSWVTSFPPQLAKLPAGLFEIRVIRNSWAPVDAMEIGYRTIERNLHAVVHHIGSVGVHVNSNLAQHVFVSQPVVSVQHETRAVCWGLGISPEPRKSLAFSVIIPEIRPLLTELLLQELLRQLSGTVS